MLLDNVLREAEWRSGSHRWQSQRSLVRTRPVAGPPPTGLARLGTGAPPAFDPFNHTLTGNYRPQVYDRIGDEQKWNPSTCSSAPHHRPRPTGGCHPTRCLPLPEPPLGRLGQRESNLGPATLASRVLPLRHTALHPFKDA